ncbi:upper collar connector [Bacillus phage DK3]|uniref:Upper collar protein n=2 Tax=Hemphillvirus TaxID=2842725 RepID=A0A3T0IIY0_9CAUD|nr:upper collar connector [Bacillus phage DK2]YP_009910524.1 upper collar connector [Bacillus phage DK3]AZU99785.1 upper collar protein [Bacillus phage DK2]AZU99832.1 upper collar protein [Bacillus phage DK3]
MFNHLQLYMNPNQVQEKVGNFYYWHYAKQLSMLTFQLFEWENLPESVDPRFLEMMLHTHGYVGFYKDENDKFTATQGTAGQKLNRYLQPTIFQTVSADPDDEKISYDIFNYGDDPELIKENRHGLVIWNNDLHIPTMDSVIMFAKKLANASEIIDVNLNAQKTPVLVTAEDSNKFSLMQIYNQYEGNAPVIVANKHFDPKTITVHKTDAPYVVDKINDQKNAYLSEFYTMLGIQNVPIDKKERLTSAEATSGNERDRASENIMLKNRKDFVERAKILYPGELEDLDVKMRTDIAEMYIDEPQVGLFDEVKETEVD